MATQDKTTSEAAKQLNIAERTLRDWIEQKVIYAYKLNPKSKSVYRVPQTEIDRILAERKNPPGQPTGKR